MAIGSQERDLEAFSKAAIEFNEAIKLDTNSLAAYCSLGTTKAILGEYQAALEYYNKAISVASDLKIAVPPTLFLNRGMAKTELRFFNEALEDYNRTIALNPNSKVYYIANAYYNRGFVKSLLKNLEGAKADYSEAIKRYPDVKNIWINYTANSK